ncbi:hypothetical protein GLYMA_11G066150v4 [Glycine max]|nr:hypothetical protein GLYMA_11G066150v4 [Glycine max]KAH1157900.1 hypothetical protein GYH30_030235 [Glycine max]
MFLLGLVSALSVLLSLSHNYYPSGSINLYSSTW